MINIKNIKAGYYNKEVLKNINTYINKNSFTGIIGPNGAGKSTLLKVLCGLIKPFSGTVEIEGKNILSLGENISKIISFMPQNINTDFNMEVKDFIMFGRYPYMNILKIPSQKDFDAIDKVIALTGIEYLIDRNINELSGGEKQKALIAQTLAQETDIIIFDEPTSHLDIGSQNDILSILRELNEKYNKTVIITLHDLNAAGEYCDNIILLNEGQICNTGRPEDVLNYKDIETVYNTKVIVTENPVSQKPYIVPISKKYIN